MKNVSLLDRPKGALKVLALLNTREHAPITEIIEETDLSIKTTYAAVARLRELNLVSQEVIKGFPTVKLYSLTPYGKKMLAASVSKFLTVFSGKDEQE